MKPPGASTARIAAVVALVCAVTAAHIGLTALAGDAWLGPDSASKIHRIDVAFVEEMQESAPPVVIPRQPVAPPAPPPPPPAPAASEPQQVATAEVQDDASAVTETVEDMPVVDTAMESDSAASAADAASAAAADAAVAAAPAASEAPPAEPASAPATQQLAMATFGPDAQAAVRRGSPAYDWPVSTRLMYSGEGMYYGPIWGSAQVDWLRQGDRYQVHMDVRVSPGMSRSMSSEGVLSPTGLKPQRYEDQTRLLFRGPRQSLIEFEGDIVRLSNGKIAERSAGVQDQASQLVQMAWLFASRPELLQLGKQVEFPLALPHRVGIWIYDVAEAERLHLPFGDIDTFRLQPRLEGRKPNELWMEIWIAPTLLYLPVRIRVRQSAETYMELSLQSRPLQAAASAPATGP